MARFDTFDRDIALATTGLSEDAISAALAAFAVEELGRTISSGQGNRNYTRFVNGKEGAPEAAVRAPGPIVYQFAWWDTLIEAALAELIARSPKKSGLYSRSFIVLANQRPVTDYENIPGNAEVIIFNAQPYSQRDPAEEHRRRVLHEDQVMPYAADNHISTDAIDGGVEITDEEYADALAGMLEGKRPKIEAGKLIMAEAPAPAVEAPPAEPQARTIPKDLPWRRATDAEAEAMEQALQAQPVRIRRIYDGATFLSEDDELFGLLSAAMTQMFGATRAAELLAPEP